MVDARPATFRSLASSREYRAIFTSNLLSLLGDQVAVVALSVLVFERSHSPFLTALVYSLAYLPWAVGGPVLATLADRWPRQRVMVVCALAQGVLVGLAALPGVPLVVLVGLVAVVAFLAPPAEAAQGALLPEILDDDRYVLASSVGMITHQASQLLGFVGGGVLAALLSPELALGIDALTFLLTALLVASGVRARPLDRTDAEAASLWHDTVEGLRWVARHAEVRSLLALVWVSAFSLVVPEALAATYAAEVGRGPEAVGVVMAAAAGGMILGSAVLSRLVAPAARARLMYPLSVIGTLPLVAVAAHPSFVVSVACFGVTGFCSASMIPAKAAVMTATDPAVRGRVFGVASTGLSLAQVVAILGAGALAQLMTAQDVIALGGLLGLLGVLALALRAWRAARARSTASTDTSAPPATVDLAV